MYNKNEEIIKELPELLEIIFKDREIENIIFKYNNKSILNKSNFTRELPNINEFRKLAHNKYPFYTSTEINNIYESISLYFSKNDKNSIFDLILYLSQCCLKVSMGEPVIIYNKLLKWRSASLRLDLDMFIAALLANSDKKSNYNRYNVDWKSTLKTDNPNIHKILNKGMAENHFHLLGSAPHFNISWVSLMNQITNRNSAFENSKMNSNSLSGNKEIFSIQELVKLAALIRVWLYSDLVLTNNSNKKYDIEKKDEINEIEEDVLNLDYIDFTKIKFYTNHIQEKINNLRFYEMRKKEDYFCFNNKENMYAGEKRLLYLALKRIFRGEISSKFEKLFYMYILIKERFRSEIIQSNGINGFENFQYYQNRKKYFLINLRQHKRLVSDSILMSVKNQQILSLEARIVPKKYYAEMINNIKDNDENIYYAITNNENSWINDIRKSEIVDRLLKKSYISDLKKKMYYVFHYPKIGDDNCRYMHSNSPRYSTMRNYLKIQSFNLAKMREESIYADRVLGIDGCGNELICRPEAFGQAFRFLKNHFPSNDLRSKNIPQLKITYHVGEDFLDVVDGLRAVNEAIVFLDMIEGDRIGHGMVLGIDVNQWYMDKQYTITITKQAFLDNIAWLIHKVKKCNIANKHDYISYLQPIYNRMYSEIYGNIINEIMCKNLNNNNYLIVANGLVSEDIYYLSMLLRGDDPSLYLNAEYGEYNSMKYWNRCAKSKACSDKVRHDKSIAFLYYLYNYNLQIRKQGDEIITVHLDKKYVEAVVHIQKCIRELVSEYGIGIETNPSSNFLIGTFKRYEKHPITTFYSNNLFDRDKIGKQINVSINTDDQGVFNTYLENEYALMALGLEKAKDEYGNLLYDKQMIYRWIDEVRNMGVMQSFIEK